MYTYVGHSKYAQKANDGKKLKDNALLASEFVALTLTVENENSQTDTIYFNGLCNSSYSIRPLRYKGAFMRLFCY